MMQQFIILALTASFVLTAPGLLSAQSSGQTPSPTVVQAAEALFPQDLRYVGKPIPEDPYDTCVTVFSSNVDGTPSLIAAAYDGDGAEIAMLAYSPSGANIISAVTNQQFWLAEGQCELQIVNLADPDHPDSPLAKAINVMFGGPTWSFIWDGEKLQNITALQKGSYSWRGKDVPNSDFYGALIVDIDHNGPMQIVGTKKEGDNFADVDGIMATKTLTLFRYNGTKYAPVKTLQYLEKYGPNLPETPVELAEYKFSTAQWTQEIDMHNTPAPNYNLRIVNGDRDGSNRVTSAKVEVNGVTIILSTEINQAVETLNRKIQLKKQNQVKVTVDGPCPTGQPHG